MEELINDIFQIIQDYRADEGLPQVRITHDRIRTWIEQFDETDQLVILEELKNIFSKRYFSRAKVLEHLQELIPYLAKQHGFTAPQDFLRNAEFLDLQEEGKSQKAMLAMLNDLTSALYNVPSTEYGSQSKKFVVYIDDVLCTANSVFHDIGNWLQRNFSTTKNNKQALIDKDIIIIFVFIFGHGKEHMRFLSRAKKSYGISSDVFAHMYAQDWIDNNLDLLKSKVEVILPCEDSDNEAVINYREAVSTQVDRYTNAKSYAKANDEFYRPIHLPQKETFFTNSESRNIVERAFLQKGIEMLTHATVTNENIRALGYSLPSRKNFGFGALCFTWRNVPNNSPLVFWYSGGGFFPLFEKHTHPLPQIGEFILP